MVPRKFEYFSPSSIVEALTLLKRYGSDAKVLAGGMSLIPVMKLRLASPGYIVDINRISGLDSIKLTGGNIVIGAMARHHDLETSKLIRENARILTDCAESLADPQVRNAGTIGGSLVHSDPSGDWGAAILAVRGVLKLRGPSKERTMKIDDFLVDTFTSALKPTELLTEISFPAPGLRSAGAYVKLKRKTGDFPTAAVGVQVSVDPDGACTYAGIGLSALGNKNLRAPKAEAALLGRMLTPRTIEEAGGAAPKDPKPISDPLRGSADYKREMAKVYTRRGLELAAGRLKGGKK
jgi:aerobic carbon-monoxide dehydrogenase medium subunit